MRVILTVHLVTLVISGMGGNQTERVRCKGCHQMGNSELPRSYSLYE